MRGRVFQSTLPRGERRFICTIHCYIQYFNPRSHEGSDEFEKSVDSKINISIHAPTRGATSFFTRIDSVRQFQSTLPRGERHQALELRYKYQNFNPRSHEGSDAVQPVFTVVFTDFNPRSHEGSDGCTG